MKTTRPSFKSFKVKALENPEINAEYEALKPIFELKKQMIQARLAANLTQEDVANLLHTKKSNISRLEPSLRTPILHFILNSIIPPIMASK